MRALMSFGPPAGNPTTMRTGLVGYVCADPAPETNGSAAAPAARCKNVRRGSFIVLSLYELFAYRDLWKVDSRGNWIHCGLMLALRITLAHFSVSSAISLPRSAGAIGIGAAPKSASRALNLRSARLALISFFCFLLLSPVLFL